jgi:hypothetical protein
MFTVLKPDGTRRVGKRNLRWPDSVEEDLKNMGVGTGDVSSRTENNGGQF